jgi:hypothetical protein
VSNLPGKSLAQSLIHHSRNRLFTSNLYNLLAQETYLLRIEFEPELTETDFNVVMQEAGLQLAKHEDSGGYKSYTYELKSESGLTKASAMFSPAKPKVREVSVRFTLPNPPGVLDQTFSFLRFLQHKHTLRIYDTEIRTHLFSQLKKGEDNPVKLQRLLDDKKEEIDSQSYISLNAEEFRENMLGLNKRKLILV